MNHLIPAGLACLLAAPALAQGDCATGNTITEGTLTFATGNPAYSPWVLEDDPTSGKGYESAVAYAVAAEMGFAPENVTWVRTSFDQAIQPGTKDFDLNMQQFSITPERDRMVDFSEPYYNSAMAVLTRATVVEAEDLSPTLDDLRGLLWGADANTTALPVLMSLIEPERDPRLYDDNTDVAAAMKAGQIDAALFDLPTALYVAAVALDDGVILGQFPPERSENPDSFGMLMEEGSALKPCVDAALATLRDDGTLDALQAEWLEDATGVPLID